MRNGCTPAKSSPVRHHVNQISFDCGECLGFVDIDIQKNHVSYTSWDGAYRCFISKDEFGTNKYIKISKGEYDDSLGYLRF